MQAGVRAWTQCGLTTIVQVKMIHLDAPWTVKGDWCHYSPDLTFLHLLFDSLTGQTSSPKRQLQYVMARYVHTLHCVCNCKPNLTARKWNTVTMENWPQRAIAMLVPSLTSATNNSHILLGKTPVTQVKVEHISCWVTTVLLLHFKIIVRWLTINFCSSEWFTLRLL